MSTVNTKTSTDTLVRTAVFETSEDLKSALLIVSAVINLFAFTALLVIAADPTLSLVLVSTN